jgi:hypothetical protein
VGEPSYAVRQSVPCSGRSIRSSTPGPEAGRRQVCAVIRAGPARDSSTHSDLSRSEDGCVRMYEAVDVMDLDSWQLAGVCLCQAIIAHVQVLTVGHRVVC